MNSKKPDFSLASAADVVACQPPRKKRGVRTQQSGRCYCGACKWCHDSARWERIFEEKFKDPAYYGPLTMRHNSTLGTPR